MQLLSPVTSQSNRENITGTHRLVSISRVQAQVGKDHVQDVGRGGLATQEMNVLGAEPMLGSEGPVGATVGATEHAPDPGLYTNPRG